MKTNKFLYLIVLQEWCGDDCGWGDSCFYDANDAEQRAALKADIKSYQKNGYKVRTIRRRVPNDGRQIHA